MRKYWMRPTPEADNQTSGHRSDGARTPKDWTTRMADEQENPVSPEESPDDTPGDSPEASVPDPAGQAEEDGFDDEPSEEDAAALEAAMDAVNQVQGVADSASAGSDGATPFQAPDFSRATEPGTKKGIDMLSDVHMNVRIELGRTRMYVEDVLKLGDGAVVELDKLAGDPVDVFVNDRRVAKGEVLVLNDMFCVRINEVVDITVDEN